MCAKQIFFFALFCISSILCNKPCYIRDNKCMTEGAQRRYEEMVKGIPGVRTSDPLHLDYFEANLPTLKYKINNGSLVGMKQCHTELVHFAPEIKEYYVHLRCPHLIMESKYEIKGYLGPQFIEENGTWKVDYYDYNLYFNGSYERTDVNDKKFHIHLKSYHLEIEATGKVHYDFKKLFNGDLGKSDAVHEFVNENWQLFDKQICQPTMNAFMDKHIENCDGYFREVPVEDVFSY